MVAGQLADTIKFDHLTSSRFDRQTDAVQLAFAIAQMGAERGCRLLCVDGLIETSVQTLAVNHSRGPQAFFSQRCHDKGLVCQRIIFLDARSTRTLGPKAAGSGIFHFHGFFLLEPHMTDVWFSERLRAVFGIAGAARRHQFRKGAPDNSRHYSFGGQRCHGATGKLAYMLSHVGTTYNRLKLNHEEKRSRRAPLARARVNRNAEGLARGIPSNFVSKILIQDNSTKRFARQAFDVWYKYRKLADRTPAAKSSLGNGIAPQAVKVR